MLGLKLNHVSKRGHWWFIISIRSGMNALAEIGIKVAEIGIKVILVVIYNAFFQVEILTEMISVRVNKLLLKSYIF